ncbi:MAG: class I SAM-dependent methyltransferase [Pseudomonadota bacterium]
MAIDTNLSAEQRERDYEDSIAHRYNRDYHEPPIMQSHSRAFIDFVIKYVHPGDRILDLGCAAASLWPYFEQRFGPTITMVGVDLSPKMIEEARELFPKGVFRIGSMLDIPAGTGEFDVVIVSSAFHHISDAVLPVALTEISRVLDEHGILLGREPLATGRLGDRGGWIAGALMQLRHLTYRLSHTREYPEPDPGPDHHAYDAKNFFNLIEKVLTVVDVQFRNPVSLFFARSRHPLIVKLADLLDDVIKHKEGQEVCYAARKNFADAGDVANCVERALRENYIDDIPKFLAYVQAASETIESQLEAEMARANGKLERRFMRRRA